VTRHMLALVLTALVLAGDPTLATAEENTATQAEVKASPSSASSPTEGKRVTKRRERKASLRDKVRYRARPITVTKTGAATAATNSTGGCKTLRTGVVFDEYIFWWRYDAWKSIHTATWCWRDGKVTSASVRVGYHLASFTFWSYAGVSDVTTGGCIRCKYRYIKKTAHFKICVAGLWPCANQFAWVACTLRGDGSWWLCLNNGVCGGTKKGG
jgi:hypothetical protein